VVKLRQLLAVPGVDAGLRSCWHSDLTLIKLIGLEALDNILQHNRDYWSMLGGVDELEFLRQLPDGDDDDRVARMVEKVVPRIEGGVWW
jgi:hypothetical protein